MTDIVHVGVTGTRHPLPGPQRAALHRALFVTGCCAHDHETVLHHGCCVNADETAHHVARQLGWQIEGHPGHDDAGRSPWSMPWDLVRDCDVLHPSRRYHLRNRDISEASSILVAVPAYPEDDLRSARSGTWMTVRYARARGRDIIIVWPDGTETRKPGTISKESAP